MYPTMHFTWSSDSSSSSKGRMFVLQSTDVPRMEKWLEIPGKRRYLPGGRANPAGLWVF